MGRDHKFKGATLDCNKVESQFEKGWETLLKISV